MKRLSNHHPLLSGILILLIMVGAMLLASIPLGLLFWLLPDAVFWNEYMLQLPVELFVLAVMVGITFLLGMGRVFVCRGRGFWRSMIPALPMLILYGLAGVEGLVWCLSEGIPVQSIGGIVSFVLLMATIGITEELTYRGLIAGILYRRYGATPAGVWFSVLVSSLIFGTVHLINAVGGAAELSGVLIQMVGASAMGMCFAAIYFRCRNLWAVAALHGFMDFCALISSGIFQEGSITETISEYSPASLLAYVFYVVVALILLRPSKMKQITSYSENNWSMTAYVGIAAALFGALAGAVLVLTI